MSDFKS